MPEETILEKAARILGDPIDPVRLLRAIEDKSWTPADAQALRDAEGG